MFVLNKDLMLLIGAEIERRSNLCPPPAVPRGLQAINVKITSEKSNVSPPPAVPKRLEKK